MTNAGYFSREVGPSPSVSVVTKQVFKANPWYYHRDHPNQVVSVPKLYLSIDTA